MSFFAKRKARIIRVDEEAGAEGAPAPSDGASAAGEPPKPFVGAKMGRKPFKQSNLRKSFNTFDGGDLSDEGETKGDENDGPVVVRPSVGRAGSKHKKKGVKPRISMGGDDGEEAASQDEISKTPKRAPLGLRAMENSVARRGMLRGGLPTRLSRDDDDRPRYSKEYLDELQSSTPNTPHDILTLHATDMDEMELDASELEGALIIESPVPSPKPAAHIPSEAEIREKKERRARLAQEQGFLSVEEDESEDRSGTKKSDARLQREDEDLGEGFDEYVEDGGLSLGRRAARERRKRERQQMAELISAAEGHSTDSSSDGDAERRIAYESAQTRAGLDGLKKADAKPADDLWRVPTKITPLPNLTECLAKLQATLRSMEEDLKAKSARVEQLRREKEEIDAREGEVQALLDSAGRKYQEAMGGGNTEAGATTQANVTLAERGLESLGATPNRGDEDLDMA